MSWSNWLLKASFKGFDFDYNVIDEELDVTKSLSTHEYPFVDGAHIEDMGRSSRTIKMSILLSGFDYERRLQKLLPILEDRGAGELIHPIYGSMQNMICSNWQIKHIPDELDCCRISVEFIENVPNAPFFDRTLSLGYADIIANKIDELLGDAFASLENYIERIAEIRGEVSNIAYVITSSLNYAANLLDTAVTSTLDLLNSPRTILADFVTIFNRIGTIGTWSKTTTISDWKAVVNHSTTVAGLPAKVNTGELRTGTGQSFIQQPVTKQSLNHIDAIFQINAVTCLVDNASDIFVDELDEPTLTPSEIEAIVSDVRLETQEAIDIIRKTKDYYQAAETINKLRDLALSLQEQAEAVIDQRPPLIMKKVEADANLRLIAFRWYGDSDRAGELLRLNTQIKHASFIDAGEVLYAYAK